MESAIPYFVTLRTKSNGIDCGIFAMRNMKKYYGKRPWRCNLQTEGLKQQRQLRGLRFKYLCKILLSDTNQLRNTLIKNALLFHENDEPRLTEEELIVELNKS